MNAIRLFMLLVILSVVTVIQCGLYGFDAEHVRRVKELSEKIWIHGAENVPAAERDISGFDLSDTVLVGLNLSYVRAHNVDWRGTTLKNVFMVGTDVSGSMFSNNNETRTVIMNSVLGNVTLTGSFWQAAKIKHCVMWDCNFNTVANKYRLSREDNTLLCQINGLKIGPLVIMAINPIEQFIVNLLQRYVRYSENEVYNSKEASLVEECLSAHEIPARVFDFCKQDKPVPSVVQRTECSICLSSFAPDDNISVLPCGHLFCSGCINEWLNRKIVPLCPDCKRAVPLRVGGAVVQAYTVVSELDRVRTVPEENDIAGR